VNQPLYSDRLLDALQVAARLHATQARKGTTIPYLSHLLGTCSIAMEFGADEDQAIAALLHDAIEDVEPVELAREEVIRFEPEVLRIVEACSDSDAHPKPPWHDRKEAYLAHIHEADAAILLVSASDKLHNARTIVTDLHRVGPDVWGRFRTASRDDSLWYYRALVGFDAAYPGGLEARDLAQHYTTAVRRELKDATFKRKVGVRRESFEASYTKRVRALLE